MIEFALRRRYRRMAFGTRWTIAQACSGRHADSGDETVETVRVSMSTDMQKRPRKCPDAQA
jgi:hypothetical protein